MLDAGASYARRGKVQIGANVNSVLRRYAEFGFTESMGHSAGIGLTTTTVAGLSLFVNQSAAFTPAYFYGLFPGSSPVQAGDPGLTAPNYTTISDLASYVYTTTLSLGRGIGTRSNVSVGGDFLYTDRVAETDTWTDISSYSLRGRYSRNTTKNIALSTELRYRSGEFGYRTGGTTTELAVDMGVDYTRPLSASRQATLGVHVGVSGADYPGNVLGLEGFRRQYRVVGDGAFNFPFSQSWSASVSIRRGVEYETDLPTPVVSNGARVSVAGLLTSRVDVLFSSGYASGESILNPNALVFDTYTGDVRVRYAVSRTFAVFGEYFYYYYDVQNGALLVAGIPPGLERNGVRAGLTLLVPAVRR